MEEYKSNSNKQKENRKVERIVNGHVHTKKKSETQKIKDVFVSEDINDVKSYILLDVLVPTIKKAISDIVTNGVDMWLYGRVSAVNKKNNAPKVSYRNYGEPDDGKRNYNRYSSQARNGYDFDNIVIDNRGEAEEVLFSLNDLIVKYGMASVADLYDLVGITGNYTDNKYGWLDVRNASVVRINDGYVLKLPKALPLN